MRRLTSLVMAGLCVCSSAAAQPGNLPGGASGGLGVGGRAGGIGRPDFQTDAAARASAGLSARPGLGGGSRPGPQFGAGADVRHSAASGLGDRFDTHLSTGAHVSAEARRRGGYDPAGGPPHWDASDRAGGRAFGATGGAHAATPATPAEMIIRNRLAAIDRLRDSALENGDTELLEHADRLEQQARAQLRAHARPGGPGGPGAAGAAVHADYDEEFYAPRRISPASGHPIGGFGADVSSEARGDGREFGIQTSTKARTEGHEFGQSTAGQARWYVERSDDAAEPSPSGMHSSGDWYDAEFHSRSRGQQVSSEARLDGRGFGHETAAGARLDGRSFGSETAAEARFGGREFGQETAADARLNGRGLGRTTAAEARLHHGDFGSETTGGAAIDESDFDHRLEAEARAYGPRTPDHTRRNGLGLPASAAGTGESELTGREFGQQTAADARLPGREFGQQTAAEARHHGHAFGRQGEAEAEFSTDFGDRGSALDATPYGRQFGQTTAAGARAGGSEFGRSTAADARSRTSGDARFPNAGGGFGTSTQAGFETEIDERSEPPRQERGTVPPRQPSARSSGDSQRPGGLFSWFRRRGQGDSR